MMDISWGYKRDTTDTKRFEKNDNTGEDLSKNMGSANGPQMAVASMDG
jgi:hypothetical protein